MTVSYFLSSHQISKISFFSVSANNLLSLWLNRGLIKKSCFHFLTTYLHASERYSTFIPVGVSICLYTYLMPNFSLICLFNHYLTSLPSPGTLLQLFFFSAVHWFFLFCWTISISVPTSSYNSIFEKNPSPDLTVLQQPSQFSVFLYSKTSQNSWLYLLPPPSSLHISTWLPSPPFCWTALVKIKNELHRDKRVTRSLSPTLYTWPGKILLQGPLDCNLLCLNPFFTQISIFLNIVYFCSNSFFTVVFSIIFKNFYISPPLCPTYIPPLLHFFPIELFAVSRYSTRSLTVCFLSSTQKKKK